ncbi:MAG TPA: methyltransferase domain-containing protein [Bryobacteraceae bacterium]
MRISRSSAPATDPFSYIREWDRIRRHTGWWHSFELPDGTQIHGVSTLEFQKRRIAAFPIPENLEGKRVLDIGTWDGWFAFEMERRGAEVVAIDSWDNPRFREMHTLLNSRVDYRRFDIYELTPNPIGKFDIVLFMGVLYHLKHPLLALERVCALTTDFAAVESFVLGEEHRLKAAAERPVMEFYENDEMGGQTDNWCAPNLPCLLALCRTAGFARVELREVLEFSGCVACHRAWLPPRFDAAPGPVLLGAYHHRNFGINFESRFDEYLTCDFQSSVESLQRDDLRPEVDNFGVNPIKLEPNGPQRWYVQFKLPPGLDPGWHEVRIRIGESRPSNGKRIAVDLAPDVGPIAIAGLADAHTWKPNELDLNVGDAIAIWVEGLPENADINNVKVFLGSTPLTVDYVSPAEGSTRQVNARVTAPLWSGVVEARVEALGGPAGRASIEIIGPHCE